MYEVHIPCRMAYLLVMCQVPGSTETFLKKSRSNSKIRRGLGAELVPTPRA